MFLCGIRNKSLFTNFEIVGQLSEKISKNRYIFFASCFNKKKYMNGDILNEHSVHILFFYLLVECNVPTVLKTVIVSIHFNKTNY